jgi:hypothetical protein
MSPQSSGPKNKTRARNQREASDKLQGRFLLGLFFDHEDEGDMFFRNAG